MKVSEIKLRLSRLERSNRRLKVAFYVCFCSGAGLILMGAASTAPKVIEAEKIILRDGAGNERGQLFANENAWGLVLFNKDSTKAASLLVSSTLNGVVLFDQNGNLRQTMTVNLEETKWDVFHPGSDAAQVELSDNGLGTALSFRDRANKPRIEMGVSPKGSGLSLSDEDGGIRASIIGGNPGFASFSQDGGIEWSPAWDKLSPEEKKKLKPLLQKMPK